MTTHLETYRQTVQRTKWLSRLLQVGVKLASTGKGIVKEDLLAESQAHGVRNEVQH
jgi:hypothetical protein